MAHWSCRYLGARPPVHPMRQITPMVRRCAAGDQWARDLLRSLSRPRMMNDSYRGNAIQGAIPQLEAALPAGYALVPSTADGLPTLITITKFPPLSTFNIKEPDQWLRNPAYPATFVMPASSVALALLKSLRMRVSVSPASICGKLARHAHVTQT